MFETGLVAKWIDQHLPVAKRCILEGKEHQSNYKTEGVPPRINLIQLAGPFILLAAGLFLSITITFIEKILTASRH